MRTTSETKKAPGNPHKDNSLESVHTPWAGVVAKLIDLLGRLDDSSTWQDRIICQETVIGA